ncbi:abscisic aldehyde oxidase 3 [Tanacetum coccineum]
MGMGMMLCGGSPSVVTPLGWGGFVACMALSERNNNPTKYAHPWESSNAMTEDMNEEADVEEFTFVLTDEWKDKAASKKDGYTLGEPSMYERKTDKLVGQDNFDTNAISDKPVVVELWLVDTGVLPIENFLDGTLGEPPLLLSSSVHCATQAAIKEARKQLCFWKRVGLDGSKSTFQLDVPDTMPVVKTLSLGEPPLLLSSSVHCATQAAIKEARKQLCFWKRVGLDGSKSTFQLDVPDTMPGIFTGSRGTDLDHGLLAVGYGLTDKADKCGVAMEASYPPRLPPLSIVSMSNVATVSLGDAG